MFPEAAVHSGLCIQGCKQRVQDKYEAMSCEDSEILCTHTADDMFLDKTNVCVRTCIACMYLYVQSLSLLASTTWGINLQSEDSCDPAPTITEDYSYYPHKGKVTTTFADEVSSFGIRVG